MKRTGFTEEQIIGVLKEAEAGAKTGDLARRLGVSEATIYNWRAKYAGLEVSEARRLGDGAAAGGLLALERRLRFWPCRTSVGALTLFMISRLQVGGFACSTWLMT